MRFLFRNPVLAVLSRLWWIPVLGSLLVGYHDGPERWASQAGIGIAAFAAMWAGAVGTVAAQAWMLERRERARLLANNLQFLCPHCFCTGDIRYACGLCGGEVESGVVLTGGEYVECCGHCRTSLQPQLADGGAGLSAYCGHCGKTSSRERHHNRTLGVLAALRNSDYHRLCGTLPEAPLEDRPGGCLTLTGGGRVVCLLNAEVLSDSTAELPAAHALHSLEWLWIGEADAATVEPVMESLIRKAGREDSGAAPVTVLIEAASAPVSLERVLESRFGAIRCGVSAAAALTAAGASSRSPMGSSAPTGTEATAQATSEPPTWAAGDPVKDAE